VPYLQASKSAIRFFYNNDANLGLRIGFSLQYTEFFSKHHFRAEEMAARNLYPKFLETAAVAKKEEVDKPDQKGEQNTKKPRVFLLQGIDMSNGIGKTGEPINAWSSIFITDIAVFLEEIRKILRENNLEIDEVKHIIDKIAETYTALKFQKKLADTIEAATPLPPVLNSLVRSYCLSPENKARFLNNSPASADTKNTVANEASPTDDNLKL
jgi:hypothetical protein